SRSKYASRTSFRKSSSAEGPLGCSTGGGGGAATDTRTLASAEPPGPLAVIVYVAESAGVTFVEPSGATAPTFGAIVNCVAFVEDQLNVVESPLLSDVGFACSVTVGRAGGGVCATGGGTTGGFLVHPAAKSAATQAVTSAILNKGPETFFILVLLDWHSPLVLVHEHHTTRIAAAKYIVSRYIALFRTPQILLPPERSHSCLRRRGLRSQPSLHRPIRRLIVPRRR